MPGRPMFSWAQSAVTSTSLRLMGCFLRMVTVRVVVWRVAVVVWRGAVGQARAGRARRAMRESSQPRQNPVTALSSAATSANPVATAPSTGAPSRYPAAPTTAKRKPTSCAKRGGASGSRSRTGPSRGATRTRNSRPYGANRRPATAPTAKTAAWTATSTPLPVSRATARTTAVTQAANRGPRTSIRRVGAVIWKRGTFGRRAGRVWPVGTDLRRSDRGSCPRGTGPLRGARSAGCPQREGSRSRASPHMCVHQSGELVRAGGTAAAPDQGTVAGQVEQRGRAADVELAHLVEVALSVDVDVGQPGAGGLQLLQAGPGRPAGAAERGGELDDGEVGGAGFDSQPLEDLRGHRLLRLRPGRADRSVPRPQPPRGSRRRHQCCGQHRRSDPAHSRRNRACPGAIPQPLRTPQPPRTMPLPSTVTSRPSSATVTPVTSRPKGKEGILYRRSSRLLIRWTRKPGTSTPAPEARATSITTSFPSKDTVPAAVRGSVRPATSTVRVMRSPSPSRRSLVSPPSSAASSA